MRSAGGGELASHFRQWRLDACILGFKSGTYNILVYYCLSTIIESAPSDVLTVIFRDREAEHTRRRPFALHPDVAQKSGIGVIVYLMSICYKSLELLPTNTTYNEGLGEDVAELKHRNEETRDLALVALRGQIEWITLHPQPCRS